MGTTTEEEARRTDEEGLAAMGWTKLDDGVYIYEEPYDFPSDDLHLSEEFEEYAERTRASWGFFNYLGVVVIRQFVRRLTNRS